MLDYDLYLYYILPVGLFMQIYPDVVTSKSLTAQPNPSSIYTFKDFYVDISCILRTYIYFVVTKTRKLHSNLMDESLKVCTSLHWSSNRAVSCLNRYAVAH